MRVSVILVTCRPAPDDYECIADCQWVIDVWNLGGEAANYGWAVRCSSWQRVFHKADEMGCSLIRLNKVVSHSRVLAVLRFEGNH